MPVTLKRIYIRHFETVKECTLDLPGPGLCLVVGNNLTSPNVKSVAAGKTTLGEAISRTLLGVKGKFEGAGLGAYSSDLCGNKDTLIKLECDMDGVPLIIWSGYKCKELNPTGEGLRFQHGETVVERGKITETRDELNRLIGVSTDLAEHTVHLDGERLRFSALPERKLVSLFLTSMSQTNWDEVQQRVGKTVREHESEKTTTEGKISTYLSLVKDAEQDLISAKETLKTAEKDLADQKIRRQAEVANAASAVEVAKRLISDLKETQEELKVKLKKLEDERTAEFARYDLELARLKSSASSARRKFEDEQASELARYDLRLAGLKSVSSAASNVVASAAADQGGVSKILEAAKRSRASLNEPDRCPTCSKPWSKHNSEEALKAGDHKIKEAQDELDAASAAYASAKAELDAADAAYNELASKRSKLGLGAEAKKTKAELDAADAAYNELASKRSKLGLGAEAKRLSQDYEDAEDKLEYARDDLKKHERTLIDAQRPADKTGVQTAEHDVTRISESLAKLSRELGETKTSLVEVTTSMAVLEYWHQAFGPCGVPNMVLGDAVGHMNHVAANLSSLLTGGLLEISFANTRQLASSAESPEMTIGVKNTRGSKKFAGASKGEAGVSNLIIAETLNELGRVWQRVGYRWLDEAVNSQDASIRGAIYGYMRQQCRERRTLIFAVDHSEDVEAHADCVLIAEKSPDGFTTYRIV